MARNFKPFGTYSDGNEFFLRSGRYRRRRRYYKNWVSDSTGYWVNRVTGGELYFNFRGTWYYEFGYVHEYGSFRYLADKYNYNYFDLKRN